MLKLFQHLFSNLRNVYGRFWTSQEGYREYYLKLDGYYFCTQNNKTLLIIRVRNKRTVDILSIQDVVNDKTYLKELHPVDACIIGILAHHEKNNLIKNTNHKISEIIRFDENYCFIKAEPILQIVKKYTNNDEVQLTVLRSKCLRKEIEIPTNELYKNPALLYALDSFQAISVGYDASEFSYKEYNRG